MRWMMKTLEEVADFCLGKMLDQEKNKGDLRPYLANVNVRWGEFTFHNLREMRFENDELERFGLKYGDIVMCEGGEPGRCAIWKNQIPGMMIQKALHRIRPHECLYYGFLYYVFLHYGKTGRFAPLFTGATISHLPREKLALLEIEIPPLSTQRKIASVLSAYDDLIENNARRIAILEAMAQAIYREWFVEFRFHGHKKGKLVNSALGQIPEGWKATQWGELATLEYGKALRGYEVSDKQFQVFGTNGPIGWHDTPLCKTPGIIIGRKGAYRGVHYSAKPFWVIDTAFYLKPKTEAVDVLWSFYHLLEVDINGMDSGSAIPSTSRDAFYALPVVQPAHEVTTRFRQIVDGLLSLCDVLKKKNANLRKTRDLLLSKLISGQLDVENLDIDTDEAVTE